MYYTDTRRATRTLISSMMGGLVLLAVVLAFTLGPDTLSDVPPLTWLVGVLVAGAAACALLQVLGVRMVRPLVPDATRAEAAAAGVTAFHTTTVLRFAIAEVVALASFAAAFLVDGGGFVLYLVGMAVSLALLWLKAWPSRRTVQGMQETLDREGARSYLLELYGFEPWTGSDDEKPSRVAR